MPLNIPTYDENNFSFGPGRLFIGAAGTTPTVDVGAISEDGVTISPENATRDISQGNPKVIVYTFNQSQGVTVDFTSIEWNFTNLAYALGAGNTTSTGTEDTFAYGGEPLTKQAAIHIQHEMAVTGHTMNAYIWKAVSNGQPQLPFTHDEHAFALSYKAQRVTTDWAGTALATDEQLMKLLRQK